MLEPQLFLMLSVGTLLLLNGIIARTRGHEGRDEVAEVTNRAADEGEMPPLL
jgi:hypothetical protein